MVRNCADLASLVDTVIRSRRTIRAFRADEVQQSVVREMLDIARAAPSTFNTQPWQVHVLTGKAKSAFSEALVRAHSGNTHPPYAAMPSPAPVDCAARQDEFGRRYYSVLGIDRADMAARSRQTARNYVFFDAPVGLIFTIDAALTKHSWLDCGMFIQNFMLAAQARGLATCPQVSFVRYQSVIADQLKLKPSESVVCGMSLGLPDDDAPLNRMQMPREPTEGFTTWHQDP
ncbi:MAG: nitroreductase [Ramlibacter sp.]